MYYMKDLATKFIQRRDVPLRDLTLAKLTNEKKKFEVIDIAQFLVFVKTTSPEHN
jgi:hypothetical protein